MKIVEIFETVPDFRTECYVSHKLKEILFIALCAILSGADDYKEIAAYAEKKENFLRQYLELAKGLPSADTFKRVFRNMDTKSFEKCLIKWSKEILSELEDYQINLDGKVLRATGKRGKKTAAICIVSAWASEHCLSLGQSKVNKKSNEKTALPELIEAVDIKDKLVTIDAMGCDKKIAAQIRENEGDYLLALKKNQKNLYEEVEDWMSKHKLKMDIFEDIDYTGGRIETRTTYVTNDLTYMDELENWKDSKTVIMVESKREFKSGVSKTTFQTRYYISSRDKDAAYFGERVRKHWSIENKLHWYLDVVFNEDRQRVREGNGAENMNILRKMGLQTLMKNKGKDSLKVTRKKAGWDEEFLKEILYSI